MAGRGPAPTPTEILERRGSKRAKCTRGKSEPQPEKGRPVCPQWLDADERRVWRRLIPILDGMHVLTKVDGLTLERYVVMYMQWRRAVQFLREHGDSYAVGSYHRAYPQAKTAQSLSTALTAIEDRFGLSPSARSRIRVEPRDKPTTGVAKFFS